ncbi:MAG TPA: tripartite tricarboxylate transporter substrate-binding protein [Candidatus Acidoferrales bacterium]|nr:tripartite tricarboxylate transporter substrate-binding protein [Candidatus Acidoferrales bacterium]
MVKRIRFSVAALAATMFFVGTAHATTHEFYKGKTIKIVVGFLAGDVYDLWARLYARHMPKHIPGRPEIIVQNMTGAGSMIAANHVYNVAKPDGLTLGSTLPSLYFDQLIGRQEVQYDWAKFVWIGSPVRNEHQMYMRSDAPYKTIEDIRKATVPPKCGTTGTGSTGYYVPKLMEETLGTKFNLVTGYQGGQDIDLAVERGELHCRAFTIEAFFAREPFHTWRKKGFVRNVIQTGRTRDPKLPDTPTIYELMEQYKTPEASRRLADVILAAGALGRPLVGPPGIPPERVALLREAFNKTLKDPEFLAEIERRKYELQPVNGEELETIAKGVMVQPPDVIERMRKLLGK